MVAEELDRAAVDGVGDARQVVGYLVRPESADYIAIMDVLEGSVTDLTVTEVAAALSVAGLGMEARLVETRLDALKDMGAVSVRSDTSRARRYAEILARNWRYTASPAGRHVQRFYRQVLAGHADRAGDPDRVAEPHRDPP